MTANQPDKERILNYRVEVDEEKMIIKKYCRTAEGIKIIVDENVLKSLLKKK